MAISAKNKICKMIIFEIGNLFLLFKFIAICFFKPFFRPIWIISKIFLRMGKGFIKCNMQV